MKKGTKVLLSVAVIGLVSYIGYKLYLKYEKSDETGDVITPEELEAMSIERKKRPFMTEEDKRKEAVEKIMKDLTSTDPVYEKIKQFSDIEVVDDEDNNGEERPSLKKGIDRNSKEALESYIEMHLSDFKNDVEEREIIRRLFTYEFKSQTMGDDITTQTLWTERESFFGPGSKWNKQITWADVLFWYAKRVEYHAGESIPYWICEILTHLGITSTTSDEDLDTVFTSLVEHEYINDEDGLFGLFGLDDESFEYLEAIVDESQGQEMSLEMEFNAYLHMLLGGD